MTSPPQPWAAGPQPPAPPHRPAPSPYAPPPYAPPPYAPPPYGQQPPPAPPTPRRARPDLRPALWLTAIGLFLFLVLTAFAHAELRHAFGVAGEAGRVDAVGCSEVLDGDGPDANEVEAVLCTATFHPADGGQARVVEVAERHEGDAFAAHASATDAYRSDGPGRLAAAAFPALALALLAISPYALVSALTGRNPRWARWLFAGVPGLALLGVGLVGLALAILGSG